MDLAVPGSKIDGLIPECLRMKTPRRSRRKTPPDYGITGSIMCGVGNMLLLAISDPAL
jgi:hypothetical protein